MEVSDEFDKILQSDNQEIDRLASELDVSVADTDRFIQENRLHGVTFRGTLNMLRT